MGGVMAVALTADGKRAVSGSDDKTLRVWDLEGNRCLAAFTCDFSVHCGAQVFRPTPELIENAACPACQSSARCMAI
jgi:WD40 repeat protein